MAIVFLWWALFGFGGSSHPTVRRTANNVPGPGSRPVGQSSSAPQTVDQIKQDPLEQMRPIVFPGYTPGAPEAKRNIFAYYEKPTPAPTVDSCAAVTPTPVPPLLLAGLQPSNVFARTDDFTMDVSGDKFTPDARIMVDGRELKTHYTSPQQLSATVPASAISNPASAASS